MKALIEKINSDAKEKEKFINFMHQQESEIKDYIQKCNDESNKFAMTLIMEFAKKEGMELKDNEVIKKVMYKLCKKSQEQVYGNTVKQFNSLLEYRSNS